MVVFYCPLPYPIPQNRLHEGYRFFTFLSCRRVWFEFGETQNIFFLLFSLNEYKIKVLIRWYLSCLLFCEERESWVQQVIIQPEYACSVHINEPPPTVLISFSCDALWVGIEPIPKLWEWVQMVHQLLLLYQRNQHLWIRPASSQYWWVFFFR